MAPRLVEPMSAYLAGLDLVDLLLGVSQGETPASLSESRPGVRTHLAMQVLLGCVRLDWFSVAPLVLTAIFLLAVPKRATTLARTGWGAHLLDPGSIRLIESEDFPL